MWKSLANTHRVYQGDRIRFNNAPRELSTGNLFQVVRTDEHYFEVCPITQEADTLLDLFTRKIVRYFDVGYHLQIEVWNEEEQTAV